MLHKSSVINKRFWNVSGLVVLVFGLLTSVIPRPAHAAGAALKISPSSGTYEVGSLVDVSVLVDTGGEAVNAISATVLFPPDKLQVVNPAASTSFVSVWVSAPSYSNTDGTVTFEGGLPSPGIKTSAGVLSTITFRIKTPGTADLKFAPTAKVLRNDGQGTNILSSTGAASFTLKAAPPAGPVVSSPTHNDQNAWYNNNQIQFVWDAVDQAVGYGFVFDQSPKTIPDEKISSTTNSTNVTASSDGVWFFHVRAKTNVWGGVTTFPVQIDTTPPATFTPQINKSTLTTEDIGVVTFTTTDAASGIDHYEVKVLGNSQQASGENTLFVESSSPYTLPKLSAGQFSIVVRAVDRAGNVADGTKSITVVSGGIPFYARVPLLQNPAVANIALVGLGVIALVLIIIFLLRRLRLRATFRHDLGMLERDAERKAQALQKELAELRQAQTFGGTMPVVPFEPPSTPAPTTSATVPPVAHPAGPIPPPDFPA